MASLATEQVTVVSGSVNRLVCRLDTIRLGHLYGDLVVSPALVVLLCGLRCHTRLVSVSSSNNLWVLWVAGGWRYPAAYPHIGAEGVRLAEQLRHLSVACTKMLTHAASLLT